MVAHIVNGKNNGQVGDRSIFRIPGLQENWNERGLPVMAVDDVRHPYVLAKFNRRSAEFGKPFRVVRIILPCHAVQLFAIEIFRVVDKIIIDPMDCSAFRNARKAQSVAHCNRQAGFAYAHHFRLPVSRKQNADFMPKRDQRFRQGLDHIREAARL